jgi:deoxyribodipyrimidine photolyase-like uncharacterized protein
MNTPYSNFVAKNRDQLEPNPRMAMIYATLSRIPQAKVDAIRKQAHAMLDASRPAGGTDGASSN